LAHDAPLIIEYCGEAIAIPHWPLAQLPPLIMANLRPNNCASALAVNNTKATIAKQIDFITQAP
jgi:hypothetical protein